MVAKRSRRARGVGRFQVMAVLQAARAYLLGMPLDSAKSWGLNRAIFYAAAKRGFKGRRALPFDRTALPVERFAREKIEEIEGSYGSYHLGDEMAYRVQMDGRSIFTIGNELQTAEDFAKRIESRFGGAFEEAWREAVEMCRGFDRGVLLSQRYFFETVYKPRRDKLATKWTGLAEEFS